jgi:hypothetical protein
MSNLDSGHSSLPFKKRCDLRQFANMLVVPNSQVGRSDTSLRYHGGGFCNHETRTTDGPTSEVHQVPVLGESIMARVLAHRRNRNAVTESDTANRKRSEQARYRRAVSIAAGGGRAGIFHVHSICLLKFFARSMKAD